MRAREYRDMINKTKPAQQKITTEDLKDTLNRVRLALAISGLMGGSIVGANAKKNTQEDNDDIENKETTE